MKKLFSIITLFFCLVSTTFAVSSHSLQSNISSLMNRYISHGFTGITVADKNTGKVLYNYQGAHYFRPGSTEKLLVATAALYQLGSHYRFHTSIYLNPKNIQQGVLHGDLYIKFTGDPSFTTHDLTNLLAVLKQRGIKQIDGNLVLDTNRFSPPNYAPGWTVNDIDWFYSAPITSVALNENAVVVSFLANHKIGSKTQVRPGPYAKFISIIPDITAASQQDANGHCQLNMRMDQKNHLYLGGCWPALRDNSVLRFAVANPTLWAENIVLHLLQADNITFQGHAVTGTVPSKLPVFVDHASQPLSYLLKHMLKISDNFYADCLLKTLGAVYYHHGNFQNGVHAVKAILTAKAHMTFAAHTLFDGSGQSYYNFVQPKQLVKLLFEASKARFFKVLYAALPISGIDGTIRYRMGSKSLLGKVRAKTGTLQAGASSLSGYVPAMNGHTLIFSIMVNNVLNVHVARQFEDAVVAVIRQI